MDKATVQISILSGGTVAYAEPINFFLLPGQGVDDVRRMVADGMGSHYAEGRVAAFELDDIVLSTTRERGVDFMDAVALLAGVAPGRWDEDYDYHPPRGSCPVLSSFVMTATARLSDDELRSFKPLVREIVNSECAPCAKRRAATLAWSVAKGSVADHLSGVGRDAEAEELRRFDGTLTEASELLFRMPCFENGRRTADGDILFHAGCAAMTADTPDGVDREREGRTAFDSARHAAGASVACGTAPDAIARQVRDAIAVCSHRN